MQRWWGQGQERLKGHGGCGCVCVCVDEGLNEGCGVWPRVADRLMKEKSLEGKARSQC